ncbi:hypothetical protein L7F22_066209 [Adiantum nelumboides]|nr:hypothetical protein [Adiantum nelumboides]
MLAAPKVSAFKPMRNHVFDNVMSSIRREARDSHGVVSVSAQLRDAMFQLLVLMCFGFDMPKETLLELSIMSDDVISSAAGALTDFYRFLDVFDGKRREKVRTLRAKQVKIYSAFIEKHKEMQKLGQLQVTGSYLGTLLNMDTSIPLSTDDLVTLSLEFTSVGIDTMVTTLEWTMACLVENPSAQEKLQQQICEVMGDKLVEEEDLQQFPYLQAVVREALRLHPPGHLLLPHSTSELCQRGYDIPPNAIVMFPVMFMAKDPDIWNEPSEFKPERFLEMKVDITGSKDMSMMLFGAGRRICPGLGLATMLMELLVAGLVQMFEWSVWPPASGVDLSEHAIFTLRMQNPLKVIVRERIKLKSLVTH